MNSKTKQTWDNKKSIFVKDYDFWHNIWLPRRAECLDIIAFLVRTYSPNPALILDIGAGTGAVAIRLHKDNPKMKAILLDGSRPQIQAARKIVKQAGLKARFLYRDFSQPSWNAELPNNLAVVVSNAAIHHATSPQKRRLFREVRSLLAPGGIFIYGDVIKYSDPQMEDRAFEMWNHDIREKFVHNGLELRQTADVMKQKLIEAAENQADLPETQSDIERWLRAAKFTHVQCVWFYLKYALYIAVK